jgi:nickel transport protein
MLKPFFFALICLSLLLSLPVQAHKLKVFATAEGDQLQGKAYFVGGAKAAGARIAITDSQGQVLARLTPDAQGHFSYQVSRRMDYQVIADSQDGHQARWTIKADELAAALPSVEVKDSVPPVTDRVGSPPLAQPDEKAGGLESPVVVSLVERAVARQIRPLREEIEAYGEQVRARDILGGIGYIVGLAGLGLWWRNRQRVEKS